jgi:hypothetical protein
MTRAGAIVLDAQERLNALRRAGDVAGYFAVLEGYIRGAMPRRHPAMWEQDERQREQALQFAARVAVHEFLRREAA